MVLGCRGSYPTSHPSILRYGGDTTCIQVMAGDTALILDAGTGIRKLTALPDHITEVHLFITHLHWDHIIGFPQFPLLMKPGLTLHIYSLERSHDRFYAALQQSVSKPLSPRSLEDMEADFRYHEIRPGQIIPLADDVSVSCALANHPYQALAYRVQHGGQAMAFIPDTAPFDRYLFTEDIVYIDTTLTAVERSVLVQRQDALIELAGDVDWMIYDAALTPAEYEIFPHWGHSTMQQAVAMGRAASVKSLVFFHHNPGRTDNEIDQMTAEQHHAHPDLILASAYAGMMMGGD